MSQQLDNSTFNQKLSLRRAALRELGQETPVIMETHGGWGKLYNHAYRGIEAGCCFERDPDKVAHLAEQRPTWSVYEADCENAIAAGVGSHLVVNFLDCDPYGEVWTVLQAWFESERPRAPRLVVVVNDGERQALRMNRGWATQSLREAVEVWGNAAMYSKYLDVCKWMMKRKAALAGYELKRWNGYYVGNMTHYCGVLAKPAPAVAEAG